MNGFKALQIIGVFALIIGSFFLGRNYQQSPSPEDKENVGQASPRKRLSAISETETVEQPKQKVSSAKSQIDRPPHPLSPDAERISEMLASMGKNIDDLDNLLEIITEWMMQDPDAAIAWLATSHRRDHVLRLLFAAWGREEPDAATAWLAANPNLEGYDAAAVGLALSLCRNNEPTAALEFAYSVTDPVARLQIWETAGIDLFSANQDELRQRLSNTDIPDEAQSILIEKWQNKINGRSKRNAQNISSVYHSALAAGASFEGATKAEIAAEIVSGVYGADSFKDTKFQIPNLQGAKLDAALENLTLDENGSLKYEPRRDRE